MRLLLISSTIEEDEIDGGMELGVPRRAYDSVVLDESVALPELRSNDGNDGDTDEGRIDEGGSKPFVKSITTDGDVVNLCTCSTGDSVVVKKSTIVILVLSGSFTKKSRSWLENLRFPIVIY